MTDDEPGLLGNLPRSRPGTRSQKRAGGAATGRKAPKAPASKAPAARRASTKRATPNKASAKRTAPKKAPVPPAPAPVQAESQDAVGDALRTAAKAANAGLRVANGVTREVLRRLPRP